MNFIETDIEGVYIIEPRVFGDERGYFFESFSQREFRDATGNDIHFVQDNEAKSKKGVLRGLHFQKNPHCQAKLVRVIKGRVLDIAVDIRRGSQTFGRHVAVELSEQNRRQLFIPKGFAHGYLSLEDNTIFSYKCDEYYHPESEGSILWNDPDLAIDWSVEKIDFILSEKDKKASGLRAVEGF